MDRIGQDDLARKRLSAEYNTVDLVPPEEAEPMWMSPEAEEPEEPSQESAELKGDSCPDDTTHSESIEPVNLESVTKEFGAGDTETAEPALDNTLLSKHSDAEAVLPSPATSSLAKVA